LIVFVALSPLSLLKFLNVTATVFAADALPLIEYVPVSVPLLPLDFVPKGFSVTLAPPDDAVIP
jgi:hypothetical protein